VERLSSFFWVWLCAGYPNPDSGMDKMADKEGKNLGILEFTNPHDCK
jgi:hypothetical protein